MTADQVATLKQTRRIEDLVAAAGFTVTGHGRVLTTKERDSLKLFTQTNSWYLYSEGTGGSIIDWIIYSQHCDFPTACEKLSRNDVTTPCVSRHVLAPSKASDALPDALQGILHRAMTPADVAWWLARGISEPAQEKFLLGVYHHYNYGLCYSIPVIEAGILVNIRLRIANPVDPKDKYRPFDCGRGTHLYCGDILTPKLHGVVIVAGELKCVVLDQYGIPAISPTAGCGHWRPEWTERLKYCKLVYIARTSADARV
jgi:hypothetical protein